VVKTFNIDGCLLHVTTRRRLSSMIVTVVVVVPSWLLSALNSAALQCVTSVSCSVVSSGVAFITITNNKFRLYGYLVVIVTLMLP
jgi:hypothetical protein